MRNLVQFKEGGVCFAVKVGEVEIVAGAFVPVTCSVEVDECSSWEHTSLPEDPLGGC